MVVRYKKSQKAVLSWTVDDIIDLFFFSKLIDEYYECKSELLLKELALKMIKGMLEKGYMIAGDLLPDITFIPWEISNEEVLQKIKKSWDSLGREFVSEEVVWFDITEKGEKELKYLNSLPELAETDPFYFDDE